MIRRLFSAQAQSITGAAIILGAASFVSRIIGVLRDRLFAHYFGAGDVLDAYYAAFRIPDFIFNLLLVGALTAGFIPVFLEVWGRDKERAWQITNSILNLIGLSMGAAALILAAFAPPVLHLLVPGFAAEKMALTVSLTRVMLVSSVLLALSGVVSSVLHAFKNFLIFALAPIFYNLGIIAGVVLIVPHTGPSGLAWGVVIGALAHIAIQLPALSGHGFRYRPVLSWGADTSRIIKLIIPRTLGLAAQQLNLLATTAIASSLSAGSVAIFNLANNLQYFPVGIIGHSFSLAVFPTFAKLVADKRPHEMVGHFSATVRQIVFLIVPVTVIFLLLRAQITRVVFGSGEFDWTATALTADTLAFFTLSLFAQCLSLVIARAFYALQDTWTPFFVGLGGLLVHIIASLYAKELLGVRGLALAYSLSMVLQFCLLWILLRRRVGSLGELSIVKNLAKVSAGAVFMALIVQWLKYPLANLVDMTRFWGILSQGLISGTIGLLGYGFVCHLLRLEEMELFRQSLQRRWLKLFNIHDKIENGG
ncbi:MAG: Integral membrane protein MviN [Candidatus Magasanikbacteria bacterium GW2011_GWA2_56_11]|uniref:Probable lipid II flippase MurJ n=1 Tax=Candidatus Magasanikbacteria bacterium GW2011_GWA2_56_11 TaxID=1619044 RepID=A0A0G1YDU8_9BACT|nr:MAG: Integral membrane protein MviN [Candidatus Magasanikbacteria bacterium GW2011_GWA2_56_11]